jgi:hypothetical protein
MPFKTQIEVYNKHANKIKAYNINMSYTLYMCYYKKKLVC